MIYKEYKPKPELSPYIESYWYAEAEGSIEYTSYCPPDCTYEIVISSNGFLYRTVNDKDWVASEGDKLLFGLTTLGKKFKSDSPIFGIRIKAFALYPFIRHSLSDLADNSHSLKDVLLIELSEHELFRQLSDFASSAQAIRQADSFLMHCLSIINSFDQGIRAQVNYILDRKGMVRIQDIYRHFQISKHKLQRDFQNKVGMNPKMISKIWRFNYFLQLCYERPDERLTDLGIDAGYYDQAHLIKDVRSFLNIRPKEVFNSKGSDFKIFQEIIQRRFNNNYDPVGV